MTHTEENNYTGGIDDFVLHLPPDELIEFMREYCGLDEFCLSLIAPPRSDELERLPKAEYPQISLFGEPSPGKSCRMTDFQEQAETLGPEGMKSVLHNSPYLFSHINVEGPSYPNELKGAS